MNQQTEAFQASRQMLPTNLYLITLLCGHNWSIHSALNSNNVQKAYLELIRTSTIELFRKNN